MYVDNNVNVSLHTHWCLTLWITDWLTWICPFFVYRDSWSLYVGISFRYIILELLCTTADRIGGISTFVISMLMEFRLVKNRGKITSLVKVVQMIGQCISVGIAWWLIPTYTKNGWRYFIIAISIPSIFNAVLRLVFWVQSPRFLSARDILIVPGMC